jgi:hypothetical protein
VPKWLLSLVNIALNCGFIENFLLLRSGSVALGDPLGQKRIERAGKRLEKAMFWI